MFLDVQRAPPVSLFMSIASGPVTGQYWREPGSMFFVSFLQVYIYSYINICIQFISISKILHKPFLGWRDLSLSLPLYERCLSASVVWMSGVALYPACTEEPRPEHNGFGFAGKCRHEYFTKVDACSGQRNVMLKDLLTPGNHYSRIFLFSLV